MNDGMIFVTPVSVVKGSSRNPHELIKIEISGELKGELCLWN